jgi:hypothetical protein
MQAAFALVQKNLLWIVIESVVVAFLTVVSFISNLGRIASSEPPKDQACSSLGLVMHKVTARPFDLNSIDSSVLRTPSRRFLWNWTNAEQAAANDRQNTVAKK